MVNIVIGLVLLGLITTGAAYSACPPGLCTLALEERASDQCYIPVDSRCDTYEHCSGDGQCFMSGMTGSVFCNCSDVRFGDRCQFFMNTSESISEACKSLVCENGGHCVPGESECRCPAGFRGGKCEIQTRSMLVGVVSNFCRHGGTPYIQGAERGCSCPCGYTGDLCEIVHPKAELYPIACRLKICNDHGFCVADRESVFCICDNGYGGEFCNEQVQITTTTPVAGMCKSHHCQNGGTCQTLGDDNSMKARCVCPPSFYGDHCEHSSDRGETNPCVYYNVTCYNGGTCYVRDGDHSPYCSCSRGFSGPFCATSEQCDPYVGCEHTQCPASTTCVEIGPCQEPTCQKTEQTTPIEPVGDTKRPNRVVYYIIIGMIPYILFIICSIAVHRSRRGRSINLEAAAETHGVDVPDTQRLTRHPSLEVFQIVDFIDSPDINQNMNMLTTQDLVRVIGSRPETLCITRLPRYESSTSLGCPPKYSQLESNASNQSQQLYAVNEHATPQTNSTATASGTSLGSMSSLGAPPAYTQAPAFTLASSDTSINSRTVLLPPTSSRQTATIFGRTREHFGRPRMFRSVSANSYGLPPPYTSSDNISVHSETLFCENSAS